jgi:heme A synthase
MDSYAKSCVVTTFGVWFQFVIAASVVLFDPNNNTFPYTQIVLGWPGVLEEIHRLFALIILALILINVYYAYRARKDKWAFRYSMAVLVLFVLQALYGAITIWSYDYPPFVVLHEGNAGVLLLLSSIVTARALWCHGGQ